MQLKHTDQDLFEWCSERVSGQINCFIAELIFFMHSSDWTLTGMHAKSCKYLYDMNMTISIKLYIYHSNIFVVEKQYHYIHQDT